MAIHSTLLLIQFIVYNVIIHSEISLLYLILFISGLVKYKSFVFKSLNENSLFQQIQMDCKDFFQKVFYLILICACAQQLPEDFKLKVGLILGMDILLDGFKITMAIHLNGLSNNLIKAKRNELMIFVHKLLRSQEWKERNLDKVSQSEVRLIFNNNVKSGYRIAMKFQFIVIP